VVVTVAGSDPSGGAGAQAVLRVFAEHGLYGTAVLTALTVQDSRGVQRVEPVAGDLVGEQLRAVLGEGGVLAMKTGMLASAAAVDAVADAVERHESSISLVVDPVMLSSSGHPLLDEAGIELLRSRLRPLACLITPNLDEAAVLLDRPRIEPGAAADAARALVDAGWAGVVVTGGHAPGQVVVDHVCLAAADREIDSFTLESPRLDTADSHGTGCLFSAAVCAALARGNDLRAALQHARRCIDHGLTRSRPGAWGAGSVWLDREPD